MHAGEVPGAGQVHIPGPACRAGRGLIGMYRRGGLQQHPDPAGEPARLHQPGGPAADQVRGLRAGLRPVAGPGPHMRGQFPGGDRPAARALLRLRHVLGDLRRRRRGDVSDLVPPLRRHRHPGQVRAAPPALRRRPLDRVIRIIHQAHRRSGIARLLTRPPFPALAQRPVSAFLPVRVIR
jgi:hypothetical protein